LSKLPWCNTDNAPKKSEPAKQEPVSPQSTTPGKTPAERVIEDLTAAGAITADQQAKIKKALAE
jgi:hypothetical protein